MHGYVTTKISGAHYALRVTIGAYFAIEDQAEGGVKGLAERLTSFTQTVTDLRIGVVNALVGAGMDMAKAYDTFARFKMKDMSALAVALNLAIDACSWGIEDKGKAGDKGDPLTLGDVYESCYLIGIKPWDADRMTLFQWGRCVEGFNLQQGGETSIVPPTSEELAALFERYG